MTKRFAITTDERGELICPELRAYKLPEWKAVDDVDKQWKSNSDRTGEAPLMYKVGYTEAREKYEFTESDLRKAVTEARKLPYIKKGEILFDTEPDTIIASLRTPRLPVAIEVEMVDVKVNPMGRIVDPMNFTQNQSSCKWENRPATYPDGTMKARWVYE